MKPLSRPPVRVSPAIRFRAAIEQAFSEGLGVGDLTLRLTLNDASLLKRDRSLAVADISFAGGAMRYLGVKIEEGGVAQSELIRSP
jgi:hypothetical protein